MQIAWTKLACSDLDTIEEYIAQDNPKAASSVILNIIDNVEKHIQLYPNIGRSGRILGTRELIVAESPYIIVYKISDKIIEILRILHSSRKWPD